MILGQTDWKVISSCAELAWRVEGTDAALLEVETSECSGAAVSHPIEGVLKRGHSTSFCGIYLGEPRSPRHS